jgi:AmmeMemoRadiSam system protein B
MSIRPSPIAGTWYPAGARELAESLDLFLARAEVHVPDGRVIGILAPHAGHRYSGAVAAHAFNCLRGMRPEVVAVVSPMHHPHNAPVLTTAHSAYATPLGEIQVDDEALDRLQAELKTRLGVSLERVRRDSEHSLEIELPFLQRVLASFRLLPVMLLEQTPEVAEALGHALAAVLAGRNAVLVASSDLSHFYPRPVAEALDREMLARIAAFDPLAVMQAEEEGRGFACGRAAVAAVLWAARDLGANRVSLLRYATSGEVTGDNESVVGYGAAVIWQQPGETPGPEVRLS